MTSVADGVLLRDATADDAEAIAALVHELAVYERLGHEVRAAPQDFRDALFGPVPRAHAMIADAGSASVGLALYFFNFSTFVGRHGLYVEDVFVQPAYRGRGIGRAFFQALAARAVAEGCRRMEWAVLDWNEPALNFYRNLGAVPMSDWTVQRLAGDALHALAQEGNTNV
jgi:GNAT superfamily N-acetyltransferase